MIYAYMRVSTVQQTLENQHYAILKFADQRAWHIDQWVTETGSGATPPTERRLGSLLEQLRAQDILLVTELSRLGRRLMEIMPLLARLLEKHVTVICIKEGLEVGDTLNAQVLAFAFGLAAEIERSLIVARTREALAQRRQTGQPIGRPRGRLSTHTKLTGRDADIQRLLQHKVAVSAIARLMGVHRTTMASYITSRGLHDTSGGSTQGVASAPRTP